MHPAVVVFDICCCKLMTKININEYFNTLRLGMFTVYPMVQSIKRLRVLQERLKSLLSKAKNSYTYLHKSMWYK